MAREGRLLTIADLVGNGTLSSEIAALFWAAVDERRSFLTVAIPRFAGKSTLSNAVLALRSPEVPVHPVAGEPEVMSRLAAERRGGYLVVAEFSEAPVPGYIWGEPVRRVFAMLGAGYALQASLHAPGIEAAVRVLTEENRVPDEQASAIDLVIYIERFGEELDSFWRRVSEVAEIDRVEGGRPVGRTLFRWERARDRFERVEAPRNFARDEEELRARARVIGELVGSGRTGMADVVSAVAAFRSGKAR
jgi:hypothetical protein